MYISHQQPHMYTHTHANGLCEAEQWPLPNPKFVTTVTLNDKMDFAIVN